MVRPIIGRFEGGIYQRVLGSRWNEEPEPNEQERKLRELMNLITTTLEPESWAVNGGSGTIIPFRDRLVVRNSPLVHQQLGGPIRLPAQ